MSATTSIVTRRRPVRRLTAVIVLYTVLGLLSLIIALPLIWMMITSFKTDSDAVQHPYSLPNPVSADAYLSFTSGQQPILRWLLNSFGAATIQTILILITASMGAYALARMDFAGKKIIFGLVVAMLMVPPVVFLLPNYLIVRELGWLDTMLAITIPGAAGSFGIFFLRQFFIGLPKEIEEAARIDGAGDVRIFVQIVLPLVKPALATLAVLSFLNNWNDFLWPVYVLLSPERMTLQPGLSMLQGAYREHFGIVMAGAAIASIPVLIIFAAAQRQIVDSVTGAAVKG
ncbi:MAG: carbohydrate ABC transporter permease [Propionibacteriaceae bacterium]|jgi:multiple sugar transport system permease protein|nr:carbohydrate ABC transporter permease [Propionibacteriaceae bacterium]